MDPRHQGLLAASMPPAGQAPIVAVPAVPVVATASAAANSSHAPGAGATFTAGCGSVPLATAVPVVAGSASFVAHSSVPPRSGKPPLVNRTASLPVPPLALATSLAANQARRPSLTLPIAVAVPVEGSGGPAVLSARSAARSSACGASGACLQETSEAVKGNIMKLWSSAGQEIAALGKGSEKVLEVSLDSRGIMSWTSESTQGYISMHPGTKWIWVFRATEGHSTTTFRCYAGPPPAPKELKCSRGHRCSRDYGHSGFSRVFGSRLCNACGGTLRNGIPRYLCEVCQVDTCQSCAEEKALLEGPETATAKSFVDDEDDMESSPSASPSSGPRLLPPNLSKSTRRPSFTSGGVLLPAKPVRKRLHRRRDSNDNVSIVQRAIPGLGTRPFGQVQSDTVARALRLATHGDLAGCQRVLLRAKSLNIAEDELTLVMEVLKSLEEQGEYSLLMPPPAPKATVAVI